MRHFVITMLAMLMAMPAMLAKGGDKYPQATFPKKSHDFGYIKEADGVVTCEFEFINTGNEPLVINSVRRTCGCTVPEYPKRPIKPDGKGVIKISFNPMGYFGGFLKTVTVRTNGREKSTTLTLEGSVIPEGGDE